MFDTLKLKKWLDWQQIGAHLCTVAVTLSFNSTLRVPREAARYGGLQYALALTAALLIVALPLALLQLAVGQLSQQDAVGLWRAVPIFKGVGYLRLVVSFFGSIYGSIYLALSAAHFLYTLRHSIPFIECSDVALKENDYLNMTDPVNCLDLTFMSPVRENPEYYIALSLIIFFIWISLPFLLYSPVKIMKRVFYLLGPLVIVLSIITVAGMSDRRRLQWMVKVEDWQNFLQPHIWFGAVSQALLTSEVAGGYLISAGDSIYSNNDVRWTAVGFIVTSIIVNWVGLVFWFSIDGSEHMETSSAAVISQIYAVTAERGLNKAWPLLAFAVLTLSGVITMLTRLYPIYDRIRRVGGVRWRIAVAGSAIICASSSVAVLAGRWHALSILEVLAVPLIACIATVLEVFAFICIYGWKVLTEDVEFLTGEPLERIWVWGWCVSGCVVAPALVWWAVVMGSGSWHLPPWPPAVVASAGALTLLTLIIFAASTVARQVQYDIIGKIKSSFQPSRHWGPRDPITHYYWLARRDEAHNGNPSSRYRRRHLGQMAGSFISRPMVFQHLKHFDGNDPKKRSNSDDWIYTIYRRKYLQEMFPDYLTLKNRSKSIEWAIIPDLGVKKDTVRTKRAGSSEYATPRDSVENVGDDPKLHQSENVKSTKC